MKRIITILSFLLFNVVLAQEVNVDTVWTTIFDGWNSEYGKSVQQTTDGGYIVAGYIESGGYYEDYLLLIKTDAEGNEAWNHTFGGSGYDGGHSVQQATDGGYIITGYTYSFGNGNGDVWLIKTDSTGNEAWNHTFGGSGYDEGHSVQQTEDGGYIITGYTWSFGNGNGDVWLIKTDSTGNEAWTQTFGGGENDKGYSVQQTTDGGYIITGYTSSYGNGGADVWLIKTDADGDTLWTQTYGGSNDDEGYSVQQTTDGGYILTGNIYPSGNWWESDVWLIKTDADGDTLWTQTYGGGSRNTGYSVQQTTDGGYILTGGTVSVTFGTADVWLIKTDSQGQEEWTQTFGGGENDTGYSVQQTTDGGYIITGYTENPGMWGDKDVWLLKVAANYIPSDFSLLEPTNNSQFTIDTSNYNSAIIFTCEPSNDGDDNDELTYLMRTQSEIFQDYDAEQDCTAFYVSTLDILDDLQAHDVTSGSLEWTIYVTDGTDTVEAENAPFTLDIDGSAALNVMLEGLLPEIFALHQNYPNPFNPITTLRYDLPENSLVNIIIYDMLGRNIKTLINQTQDAGYKSVIWDATNDYGKPVSAGVYLYQIQAGEFVQTKKMVLLK
jgi:hypothetical protein